MRAHPNGQYPTWTWILWLLCGGFSLFLIQCTPVAPSLSKTTLPPTPTQAPTQAPAEEQRVELPHTQLLFRLTVKTPVTSSRANPEAVAPVEVEAKKHVLTLNEDQLDAFKKDAAVELPLPDDAVPASIKQALLRIDLGKAEIPVDEALALELILKANGEGWSLKISEKTNADVSKRLREKLAGISVIYASDQ